jgi:TetR/AcrR family transcriptional regulator, mexJK operon transcriptional repressor
MNEAIENLPTTERIIAAATKLFTETGYARTTTKAIAAAAGVNEVTIFRQFGSKKSLFLACLEAFNAAGFAGTFARSLTGDYAADILTMAQAHLADSLANFEGVRLLICEASEIPEIRVMMQQGYEQNLATIAAYFQSQIDAGVIRPNLDAVSLAQAFGNLFSNYQLLLAANPEEAPAAQVQQFVDIFVKGTMRSGD